MKIPKELEKDLINTTTKIDQEFPGHIAYPASEDIYQQIKEEIEINPADTTKTKTLNKYGESMFEKDFSENMLGNDLDIPGSELDDHEENVGSEDEENNYYSLGGDNHNDLEEYNG